MILTKAMVTFIFCFLAVKASATPSSSERKCAVLLHGLARSAASMEDIADQLRLKGYIVWNDGYASRQEPIEELALVIDDALYFCHQNQATDIYFATHSLGGILVRQYYQDKPAGIVRAVVMLAPPNHGSELSDAFKEDLWFWWYTGFAGQQLGTEPESLPNRLKAIVLPIGIIAGTASSDPWFSHLFVSGNDGKVSVKSTQLSEMKDFMTVNEGHTYIMKAPVVIEQILYFFENSSFKK